MRKLKLFGLLSLCCCFSQIAYGTENEGDEKENRAPNLPVENQTRKNPNIQQSINEENLPTDSNALNLRGHLTAEALQKLRNPHYREISLYMVSGEEDKDYFYKDYLIVSPKIINPNVRNLSLVISRVNTS